MLASGQSAPVFACFRQSSMHPHEDLPNLPVELILAELTAFHQVPRAWAMGYCKHVSEIALQLLRKLLSHLSHVILGTS